MFFRLMTQYSSKFAMNNLVRSPLLLTISLTLSLVFALLITRPLQRQIIPINAQASILVLNYFPF